MKLKHERYAVFVWMGRIDVMPNKYWTAWVFSNTFSREVIQGRMDIYICATHLYSWMLWKQLQIEERAIVFSPKMRRLPGEVVPCLRHLSKFIYQTITAIISIVLEVFLCVHIYEARVC